MRAIPLRRCLWIWMLVTAACVQEGPAASAADEAHPVQLVLELTDGSRVVGVPSVDHFKVKTEYADLDISLALVRTIEFGKDAGEAAHVSLGNGDLLNGRLDAKEIPMKTIFGQVVIPIAQVLKIRVAGAVAALPEGLVLYYTFDKDDGGKVTDASGSGNDGIVRGATWSNEGKSGGAMSFNGDSQGVITKNSDSLQLQDFTIAAWVKRGDNTRVTQHGINGSGVVFAFGEGGYGLAFNQDGTLGLTKIGVDGVPSTSGVHDGDWHHVAVTKKGNKVVFYVDAVAFPAAEYNSRFEFVTDAGTGARGDDVQNSFIGLIDELMVFKRALSEDEIKGVYESQK